MENAVLGLIYGFIIFSILPFIKTHIRWIRFFDYPRVQVAIGSIISLILGFTYLDLYENKFHLISVILICCTLFYQIRMIVTYTFFYRKEVLNASADRDTISVLISNVKMSNRNYPGFIEIVKKNDPDIVLTNEVDNEWIGQLKILEAQYIHSVKKPLDNTYGMALYSKVKLKNSRVNFLVSEEIPSIKTSFELSSGEEIDFYGVHPKPPTLHSDTEERDAELIIVGKTVKKNDRPAIVAGDLNDVAWSRTTNLFKKISGLLDPRVGRGFFNTYNAFVPVFRYPLDYIFISRSFRLIEMKRLERFGSDHFPMLIRLSYEPDKKHQQKKHKADSKDKKEAEEILQKAGQ
jgi:endonuclease/exonuclease/phosphatase (EEP) superfamily protein YafD